MDSKQNLTPELKEIYDRVMNTPAGQSPLGGAAGAKGAASATPATGTPVAPPPTTGATPIAFPEPHTVNDIPPPPTTNASPIPPAPEATPPVDSSEYLSSAQPRPLQDIGTKPFSFSGKIVTATTADAPAGQSPLGGAQATATVQPTAAASAPKKGLSTPVVVVLFIAFALVWTFFWLVLLGFIKF